jgi:hypothetical protein
MDNKLSLVVFKNFNILELLNYIILHLISNFIYLHIIINTYLQILFII